MAKKRAVNDENSVLFNTAVFSSKNEIGGSIDSAWDDGSAFPEISSKKWVAGDAVRGASRREDGKPFKVGQRVTTSHPLCKGKVYTIGVYPSVYASGEITYEWIETTCNLVLRCDSLTSVQESEQDSASLECNTDLTLSEPQRLTITAQTSLDCDIQKLITMETCKALPIVETLDSDQEQSISSQLPHPALHFPQKAIAKEPTTRETVSPQFLKLLTSANQNSPQSKMSQVCSPVPTNVEISGATSGIFYSTFPPAGMMLNGLLSEAATLALPLLEKEYCWLPSPGALSFSGKGRPPGQTKQEGGLKDLGLLQKGEVLNPDILCEWYGLPPNWLDPSESRAATELLENNERQQEICLTLELQRSPLTESSTLTHYAENQPLARANAQPETYIINQSQCLGKVIDNLGFGFTVKWLNSSELITYNWERDDQQIIGFAIAPQYLIDRFLEEKSKCQVIPENFLEETKEDTKRSPSLKRRQRKGCLYKYLENKKLKDGRIASYPSVVGHRQPDNPTHWRWGFNWEEKVDGEWKGRSIGSVPLGAIALIQSMQKEGVSLEEIIGFIRRAKSKS